MNVFDDLIEELKEENLLESTIYDVQAAEDTLKSPAGLNASPAATVSAENFQSPVSHAFFTPDSPQAFSPLPTAETIIPADLPHKSQMTENAEPISEKEFYRKRAMEEVSGLQMVEHIISGVEREQMKVVPSSFDDLQVKKSLHAFLQIVQEANTSDHATAEFELMQETEKWCSALSHRDKRVSVAHLRRFCETTKPGLSSHALIALARFYRNLSFSEQVRGKFELVITRLFTKDLGNDKRMLVFTRDEFIEHLKELYADWSSIQLYSDDEQDSTTILAAVKFEDFIIEAEKADNFDELVRNDFFNRLRVFKESTNEMFYAPLVAAAAVECNIKIGNRYVDLIEAERDKTNAADLQSKYGFLHDQSISDAASKTLQLVELLKDKAEEPLPEIIEEPADDYTLSFTPKNLPVVGKKREYPPFLQKLFAVNKFLLAATVISIVLSFGLYFWVNGEPVTAESSKNVRAINLENSALKDYISKAGVSGDACYAVTSPSWNDLPKAKKEEIIKSLLLLGKEKGFVQVHLLNSGGGTVGFASNERLEISINLNNKAKSNKFHI